VYDRLAPDSELRASDDVRFSVGFRPSLVELCLERGETTGQGALLIDAAELLSGHEEFPTPPD